MWDGGTSEKSAARAGTARLVHRIRARTRDNIRFIVPLLKYIMCLVLSGPAPGEHDLPLPGGFAWVPLRQTKAVQDIITPHRISDTNPKPGLVNS